MLETPGVVIFLQTPACAPNHGEASWNAVELTTSAIQLFQLVLSILSAFNPNLATPTFQFD